MKPALRVRHLPVVLPFSAWFAASWTYNAGHTLPSCPFKALTGLDCPGCGSTRAGAALLRGDLLAALDHNLFATVLPVCMLAVAVAYRVSRARTGRLARRLDARLSLVALVALGAFWALRLVPVLPFSYLASS